MGLFSKIKNMFKGENKTQEKEIESKEKVIEEEEIEEQIEETKEQSSAKEVEQQEEVFSEKEIKKESEIKKDTSPNETPIKKANKVYEKGLTKSRKGFVSNLINLTSKYHRINEEYFEELENLLIMADYLPLIGEFDGNIDIKGENVELSFKNIKGFYMNSSNVFNLMINEGNYEFE